jgi:hypothetical protein
LDTANRDRYLSLVRTHLFGDEFFGQVIWHESRLGHVVIIAETRT